MEKCLKISVLCDLFIISFYNFVPRLYYSLKESENNSTASVMNIIYTYIK